MALNLFLNYEAWFAFLRSRLISISNLFERQFQETLVEEWGSKTQKGRNPITLLSKSPLWAGR